MKVAVTSEGKTLDSAVSRYFARCNYFLIIDQDKIIEVIENKTSGQRGGRGIAAAQLVADKEADAVITGNIGPRALNVLKQFNIPVHISEGSVKDALQKI